MNLISNILSNSVFKNSFEQHLFYKITGKTLLSIVKSKAIVTLIFMFVL